MKISPMQVTLVDHMGSDLHVANAARVSFDKESEWVHTDEVASYDSEGYEVWKKKLSEKDTKLISYLAKHKHTSPFNHCFTTFRVKAPIFVARQLVKHKFMPWNEVSRRYVDSEPEFYVPEEYRGKAENVKQGSTDEPLEHSSYIRDGVVAASEVALVTYNRLLHVGTCAEQARMVLPLNSMTEWMWSGTLGAFADMCRLRLDPHAQKETREIAELISKEMSELYPVSWKALLNNDKE